jgi:hypothetical protein
VLTLFRSPSKKESELLSAFDAVMDKYTRLTSALHAATESELELESLTVLIQETKTQLNLVNKLTSSPCLQGLDKPRKKERTSKL